MSVPNYQPPDPNAKPMTAREEAELFAAMYDDRGEHGTASVLRALAGALDPTKADLPLFPPTKAAQPDYTVGADPTRSVLRGRSNSPCPVTQEPCGDAACRSGCLKVAQGQTVTAARHEHETDRDGRTICTTSGEAPSKVRAEQVETTGQHKSYIVLCEEERKKGFVRPYRDAYRHVGPAICGLHVGPGGATVCYMDKKHEGPCGDATGPRPQACGKVTTMGRALSETYARDPTFYGATFCASCDAHYPVDQFVWTADGARVGS